MWTKPYLQFGGKVKEIFWGWAKTYGYYNFPPSFIEKKEEQVVNKLHLEMLGRELDMSNKEWPSQKGCKPMSKLHPRHAHKPSQQIQIRCWKFSDRKKSIKTYIVKANRRFKTGLEPSSSQHGIDSSTRSYCSFICPPI